MESNIIQSVLFLLVMSVCGFAQQNLVGSTNKISTISKTFVCICVPFYQCDDGNIITDGSGIIGARRKNRNNSTRDIPVGAMYKAPSCGDFYVCCKVPSTGPPAKPYPPRCGVRQPNGINSRILSTGNKSEAQFGEWPWQAMVLKRRNVGFDYICGAVLIDSNHVLTAAHCVIEFVASKFPTNLVVRLGEWDTRKTNEFLPFQDQEVVAIRIHPEYRNSSLWNDIAVLRLRGAVTFAPNVDTICLPKHMESFLGKHTQCVVTGWGKNVYDGGKFSNILKAVAVPVINHNTCQHLLRQTRLGKFFILHNSFLCAGGHKNQDSCKGDGGGPLSCYRNSDGVYVLAGLVSWGIDCGRSQVPGVYVSVVRYLDWITKVTGRPLKSYWPTRN